MRIERISSVDRFLQLESQWNLLGLGDGQSSPALAHQWFSCWLGAFGKDSELAVVALFNDERLVAAAPLHIVRSTYRAIPCRQLRFLYNRHGPRCGFLLREGYEQFAQPLINEVLKLPGWDIAVFENMPAAGSLHALCAQFAATSRHSTLLRETVSSPVLKIAGEWAEFFSSRSRNLKRSLRKKEKKVAAAGKVTIDHFTDAASSVAIMPELIALGERSWKARGGRAIGSQPESRQFYTSLADAFGKHEQVSIWLMRIGGEPAAFEFHLVQGKRVQALRSEFSEKYRGLGVGSVLDKEIIKWLFQTGFEEYDMGGLADFYKLRWTESVRRHFEFLVFGKCAVGRLLRTVEKGLVEPLKKVLGHYKRPVVRATAKEAESEFSEEEILRQHTESHSRNGR